MKFGWRYFAGALVGMALIALVYFPGLSGPFLFDDFSNLDDLGAFGPIDDWKTFLFYLTSGTADPTGRPVALLTFLIDAQDWPAHPWPFKRTNLVLHLVNAALLAAVVGRLQAALAQRGLVRDASPWTPLVAAIFWGGHPLFVSTTLYVVQREAMLPATFAMLALLAWDRAMQAMDASTGAKAWLWAVVGVGSCTVLAGFSKANGFLVPLLVGLIYLWCYRPTGRGQRRHDLLAATCLGIPSLFLIGFLLHHAFELWSLPYLHGRDWTLPERLLSQPRAIWDYVFRLALPRSGGGGLYVDDFAVSRGWLEPATTLPAVALLAASILAAVAARRRFPVASIAWLFFLSAHLLESSVVALELYFEHRNYLPAMLLGWPLAHALLCYRSHARARAALAGALVAILLLLTWQRAVVWGNPALLTALSAEHRDDSIRAQVTAINQRLSQDGAGALAQILALQQATPESVLVAVNAITTECITKGDLSQQTLARSRHTLATAENWNYGLHRWLADAAIAPVMRRCRGFGAGGPDLLVDAALDNPANQGTFRRRDFLHVRGQIALAAGRPDAALHWFNAALDLKPDPDYALVQAAALGNADAQTLGVAHLDHYGRKDAPAAAEIRNMGSLHRWLLAHYGYYRDEIRRLRSQLAADARAPGLEPAK